MKAIIYRALFHALQEAEMSDCPNFRVGALVFKGNRMINFGRNYYHKTSPHALNPTKKIHAEFDALNGITDGRGLTLYVARIRNGGTVGMAKPCEACHNLIKRIGISEVWFTNRDGLPEKLL